MTSFINDNGDEILISEELTFTRQVASFFTFQVKGDFSVTFSISNTSKNRTALNIYGLQQIDPDVKQRWNLHINGNKILTGSLIVQKINQDFIEIFFIGGNSNWINGLIESTADLNMISYVSPWTETNIMTTSIANDYGIVYPLCDWAYNFNKTTSTFRTLSIYDSSDKEFTDFYPCFYLKDLVKQIVQQSGYNLDGDILDDGIYNKLIITPATAEIKRNASFVNERSVYANKSAVQNLAVVNTYYKITFDDIIKTSSLFSNSRYTGDAYYNFTLKLNFLASINQAYTISLYIDGVSTDSNIFTSNTAEIDFGFTFEMLPNRYFEIYVKVNSGGATADISVGTTLEIKPDEDVKIRLVNQEYVYPNDFIQMKSIDVMKFVIMYFGCYAYFDEQSKKIVINKIDKINKNSALDWSSYLKSYETLYDPKQATNNYFRFQEPTQDALKIYNSRYVTGFGEGNFTTNSDINKTNELYKAPFQASEAKVTVKYGQLMMANIGLIELDDEGEFSEYTTVTDSNGIAQFNGIGFNLSGGEVVRVLDDNSVYSGYLVVISTTYYYFQCQGMAFKGTSTGKMYKQKASFPKGANRLLLNIPNYSLGNVGAGDDTTPIIYTHNLSVDTQEAVSGSPVYTSTFANTTFNTGVVTTGTQISTDTLTFDDDVTCTVVRTSNCTDVVQVLFFRNGVLENTPAAVTAGNPVSISYTYTTTLSSDSFEVTITEG